MKKVPSVNVEHWIRMPHRSVQMGHGRFEVGRAFTSLHAGRRSARTVPTAEDDWRACPPPFLSKICFVSFRFLRWRASRVPNLTLSPSGSAAVSPAIAKEGMDLAPPLNFLFYNFSIIYYDFLKIQRK
jgi:hypothetical protein